MSSTLAWIRRSRRAGQDLGVTLAGDDGADNPLTGHADDIGNHMMELHVHLVERFLQMLHVAALISDQHVAVSPYGTQGADLILGPKRAPEQTEAHQPLQPLAIQHITFAPRHISNVPGIDPKTP